MEGEAINMKDVKKELRKKKIKQWFIDRKNDALKFYYDHEETVNTFGPAIIAGAGFLGREVIKNHRINKEEKMKDCYHWDPRRGTYYQSRRPLKSSEQMELDRLYAEGYTKGEALRMMKLLK